jgi:hypothetical protein
VYLVSSLVPEPKGPIKSHNVYNKKGWSPLLTPSGYGTSIFQSGELQLDIIHYVWILSSELKMLQIVVIVKPDNWA